MNAIEFKNGIKEIKESLKGLTLQLVHANGYRPYFNLRDFGFAVLDEEEKGNDFNLTIASKKLPCLLLQIRIISNSSTYIGT